MTTQSWTIWAVSILVCGCGRIGFESTPGETAAEDPDAGAPAPAVEWIEVGDSASGLGASGLGSGSVATTRAGYGPDGTPYVAWTDPSSGTDDVYLKKFDGEAWVGLGGSDLDGGPLSTPGDALAGPIVVMADGNPGIFIREDDGARPLYFRVWDGAEWTGLAGSDTGAGFSQAPNPWWPSAAVRGEELFVGYESYNISGADGGVVFGQYWNGSAWKNLGGAAEDHGVSGGVGRSYQASVAMARDGRIAIAYANNQDGADDLYVAEWSGAEWILLGGTSVSASAVESRRPELVYLASGELLALWQEDADGGSALIARAWNGTSWAERSPGMSQGGIGGLGARHPVMTLDHQGRPVVAWTADDSVGTNVHVAHLEGSTWTEIVLSSGGVSNSAGSSEWPSLSSSPKGLAVGWHEDLGPDRSEVYLRVLRSD